MRILTLLTIFFFSVLTVHSQEFYENEQFGVKVLKPAGWILATEQEVENSLKKVKFTDDQIAHIVNSKKGIVSLCTFYKYRIDSAAGLIPTVKITVRSKPECTFGEFKEIMIASAERLKATLANFQFIEQVQQVSVGGSPSVYYSSTYSLALNDERKMKVRTRSYMIPREKYFISITLMDNESREDNSKIYDELIKSFQFTN